MSNHTEVRFFSAFRVRGSSPPGMQSADSRWRGWGGGSFFPTIISRQISKLLSKFVVLQKYPNRSYDVLYAYVFYRTTIFLSDKWQQHFGTFWGLIWIGGTHEWHVWVGPLFDDYWLFTSLQQSRRFKAWKKQHENCLGMAINDISQGLSRGLSTTLYLGSHDKSASYRADGYRQAGSKVHSAVG